MRFLIACDSFKESCSAELACERIAEGLRSRLPDCSIDLCPLADGGEGTLAVLARALPLQIEPVRVMGPLGDPVLASVAWTAWSEIPEKLRASLSPGPIAADRVAWLEAATCLGLGLVPQARRNPLATTSCGLGQLLKYVSSRPASLVVVGLGGTSSVDAGIGMAQALGLELPGVPVPATGGDLEAVAEISAHRVIEQRDEWRIVIASDVENPLLGPRGAAHAFAPQKGASDEDVARLERGIRHFAELLTHACTASATESERRSQSASPDAEADLGEHARRVEFERAVARPGAGAAGGIGFALHQLLQARHWRGVDLIMQCVGFDERLAQADWVVTGEGRLDRSSFEGKVVSGVVERARARGVQICGIFGASEFDVAHANGFGIDELETLREHARDLADAKLRVQELLRTAAERFASRLART